MGRRGQKARSTAHILPGSCHPEEERGRVQGGRDGNSDRRTWLACKRLRVRRDRGEEMYRKEEVEEKDECSGQGGEIEEFNQDRVFVYTLFTCTGFYWPITPRHGIKTPVTSLV